MRVKGAKVGKPPITVTRPAFASSKVNVELDGYKKGSRVVRVGGQLETVEPMLRPAAGESPE